MDWNSFLVLLVSFTGTLFGIILALIAPEELDSGKRYFFWLKRIMFLAIMAAIDYYFIINTKYLLAILFSILFATLFLIEFKAGHYFKHSSGHKQLSNNYPLLYMKDATILLNYLCPSVYLLDYILFALAYFIIPEGRLVVASLIFIYGMPVGTLLWKK